MLQLRSNIETFQAKHGITGGGKYGTYIKKSYTPQQKSQMVAILNNFLDQTGSSISAIRKSYKEFERGLEKLGKKYKVPATAAKMAERLDKREAIVKEAYADKDFTFSSTDEGWCSILIDESQVRLMKVLNHIQEKIKVYDVRLEEISTESVIRKIYEDAENMKKAN